MAYASSYQTQGVVLNAAILKKQNNSFNAATMDRKKFLSAQIINLNASIGQYHAAMTILANEAAQLDGKSDAASWLASIGTMVLSLDIKGSGISNASKVNTYSKAAGAAMVVASVVINIFEKKKDDRRLKSLYEQTVMLRAEMQEVEALRQSCQSELNRIIYLPYILFGVAFYMLSK